MIACKCAVAVVCHMDSPITFGSKSCVAWRTYDKLLSVLRHVACECALAVICCKVVSHVGVLGLSWLWCLAQKFSSMTC